MNIFLSVLTGCVLLVVLFFKKPTVKQEPKTVEDKQAEKCRCILRNKDVFAKITIQKAQQFLDTYTNNKSQLL